MDAFDAVVVGAGHNGLAAAVHLLQRRWSVAVIEGAEEPGGAVKTRDFKTFTDVTKDVSFPAGHKHGTAIRVPHEILDGLLKNSGSATNTNL